MYAYPSVSNTPNLIIAFVYGPAGDTSWLDWLMEITMSHSSSNFRMASGRQKAEDG